MSLFKEDEQEQQNEFKDLSAKEHKIRKNNTNRKYAQEIRREQQEAAVGTVTPEAWNDIWNTYNDQVKDLFQQKMKSHTAAIADPVPFISLEFDKYFKMTPGQLVSLLAYTGEGKTTNSANIACSAILKGKKVLVLSNEESSSDYLINVACLIENLYQKDYDERTMLKEDQKRVGQRVLKLLNEKSFTCIDEDISRGGTCRDEYILQSLMALAVAEVKPDVVIIDYLTNIYAVGSTGADNHYYELGRFLGELKNLINKLPFPVVMCAQLHSDDKKKGQKGKKAAMDTKLVMGGDILRCSTIAVEVSVDFETRISTLTIHKNRKYKEKGSIRLKFDKGRLNPVSSALDEILTKGDK